MKYQKVIPQIKTGTENFNFDNQILDFKLNDFWIWNQSNLIENRTRGMTKMPQRRKT